MIATNFKLSEVLFLIKKILFIFLLLAQPATSFSNTGFKDTGDLLSFDGWYMGLDLYMVKQKMKSKNLGLSPSKNPYLQKYNEKVMNKKKNERIYSYRTDMLGKSTTVRMFFTLNSKKLYRIEVSFNNSSSSVEEKGLFYQSLYSSLSKKYGKSVITKTEAYKKMLRDNPLGTKAMKSSLELNHLLRGWGTGSNNELTLSYRKNYDSFSFPKLVYKNLPLTRKHILETTKNAKARVKANTVNDESRL